ncbi:MAG: hypothetical protein KGO82_12045 [Bacteroidota bacterium]|nr:hypothetical protein [Bacteroidota bacterium]
MKYTLLFSLLVFAGLAHAQDQEPQPEKQEAPKGFDKSRLFIGGNLGLNFSSYYTLVNVSPQLGYRFNDYIAAGAGVNFIYSSQKDYYTNGVEYSRTNYGVAGLNIFGRVYPIQQVFLQLQPEMNYTWGKRKYYDGLTPPYKYNGEITPSLLGGVGGALSGGGNSAFIIMIQYDLLQNNRTPYGSRPFFSFGYNIGL